MEFGGVWEEWNSVCFRISLCDDGSMRRFVVFKWYTRWGAEQIERSLDLDDEFNCELSFLFPRLRFS